MAPTELVFYCHQFVTDRASDTILDRCMTRFHDPNEKKRSERRKHCALVVVRRSQKFSPRLRGAELPKFNQLEMVTTFAYRPSLVKINARNFELTW